ncbi:MAG: hypothetical protein AB7U97_04045 [Pirellulales bacterium]
MLDFELRQPVIAFEFSLKHPTQTGVNGQSFPIDLTRGRKGRKHLFQFLAVFRRQRAIELMIQQPLEAEYVKLWIRIIHGQHALPILPPAFIPDTSSPGILGWTYRCEV